MRYLVCLALAACGDNLAPAAAPDGVPPDAARASDARDYYGLLLGAHWTYATSSGSIDKRIVACTEVTVPTCDGALRHEHVWVRETRDRFGALVRVHYLRFEPGVGVVRLREDRPDGRWRTWTPYELRLIAGPYLPDSTRTITYEMCNWNGAATVTQTELVGQVDVLDVMGEPREAQRITHIRSDTSALVTSWYVPGIGEVREENGDQSEVLTGFEPGFGECP